MCDIYTNNADHLRIESTDPRADHLYYTLWVNRSQPVNAYGMQTLRDKNGNVRIEKIVSNVTPKIKLEA